MKFVITLDGNRVIVSHEQLEVLVDMLAHAEVLDQTYAGSGQGEDGTNYITTLRKYDATEKLSVKPFHEDFYEARKLATKLYDERQAKK